jgi:hypothetical protein
VLSGREHLLSVLRGREESLTNASWDRRLLLSTAAVWEGGLVNKCDGNDDERNNWEFCVTY